MEYETLKFIWWALIGVLFIGFALTDGFDMGVGILLRFIGKTNMDRRIMINTIGPHWESNQTWFICASAALFAAWPLVYAVSYAGLFPVFILILCALIVRVPAFIYRSKVDNPRWRNAWDWGLTLGSLIPTAIFGVIVGNLFLGLPFELNNFLRSTYHGSFFSLFKPFPLLCGLLSVAMLVMHGGAWLQMKTTGMLLMRAQSATKLAATTVIVLFLLAGIWLWSSIDGMHIVEIKPIGGVLTPLMKSVAYGNSGWQKNFEMYPILWGVPMLALLSALTTLLFSRTTNPFVFIPSSLCVMCIILTSGVALFPFVFPSSYDPNFSLTLWDATSSKLTLGLMFFVAAILIPIVMLYTIFAYRTMFGRITRETIEQNSHSSY
ncbi:MAG: cytochrome d ubiquinol oxidase subunit II [Gammaproteobacteria bacterium]|nr:cytochrome d ubiquinol oxidase subunit II [Gammaproteobacteria bacterium]